MLDLPTQLPNGTNIERAYQNRTQAMQERIERGFGWVGAVATEPK